LQFPVRLASQSRSTSHKGSLLSTVEWIWDRHVVYNQVSS
jgi:hypothetical protein